ncbi:hypothetical protein QOZ80_1BG0083790 [Eleusine coracana subsp. coracana]|nr:hypothetical protein QOZ80_1BG0083790 [Eleusine coracana subsp. coracana]
MDCPEQQQQHLQEEEEEEEVMEMPEIDGDLLAELLDASLAGADEETDQSIGPRQLGFTADVDGWVESDELNSIHPHHDCEDCGLDDGGGVLSDFDELDGCGCSPSPYAAFDDDDTAQWTETADAALGPFVGECMGDEWYMDGMAMEWEEDEGNGFSFGPYYYGGEVGNTEQVYGSSLWE